mmetsp:Transcript_26968/g.41340  ORF Transcript_26968/g.41340 Transcript_26968/m.41340 type:complete len:371 (+) Transcript_26968:139-1251(+)
MPPCGKTDTNVVTPLTREELGDDWVQGKTYTDKPDFTWMDGEEPHRARRMEILKKHPEIKQLYGHEWKTKYMVGATVLLQTCLAFCMKDTSWPLFLLTAYVVGATANHSLFLAIHEWSHNLGFKLPIHNQIGSMFANLPIGVPYSASFKPYHMDHHRNQGVDGLDADIAHPLEADIIRNRTPMKALYMLTQLAFYALRPCIIKPLQPTKMTALNLAIQLTYDAFILYFGGFNALLYLLVSTVLCGSFHPTAGHFLSEHLEVIEGIETYSYYGPLNYVTYNVGYHNEHHDFPYVPWSRLPEVTKIAAEYYDPLPRCESWVGIIWQYVTNPNLGAYSRVKRRNEVDAAEVVNPNDSQNDPSITSYNLKAKQQ